MRDAFNRLIDYMRVSVTDRCNLRCKYCMPDDLLFVPHADILRYEEVLRLCGIASTIGVQTIKVTGGEPLLRKGCVGFIRDLKALPGIKHATLTTNGILLEQHVDALAEIGLDGVNISLDSLDAETYLQLTGRDEFLQVWKSLHKAVEAGLRVKINCVPLRGLNEAEIVSIAQLAERYPVDVRFIGLMPAGTSVLFERIPGEEILERLKREYSDLAPDETRHGFGPVSYYSSSRLKGGVGVIDAVNNQFCVKCNRVRLTSEGFLKLCLSHDDGIDLRAMLRGGASDSAIEAAMSSAIFRKPEKHSFGDGVDCHGGIKKMSQIGG
ncbi:MAG: GTP 3',8-cyclase MoaA [Oscillospiraceae bacterium]|nr:GTP 3',8-cyclase MoaA [Oscillospiraceae bacterium]